MSKNIQIPFELLLKAINIMEKIDLSNFDHKYIENFNTVLSAFHEKRSRSFQRDYYSVMVCDPDEKERAVARMMYCFRKKDLQNK